MLYNRVFSEVRKVNAISDFPQTLVIHQLIVSYQKNNDMNFAEETVAAAVTENIRTADVFKKHGIDFCCGGNVSLKSVCEKKNLDMDVILAELGQVGVSRDSSGDQSWDDAGLLIDHILERHHSYVAEAIPILLQYSDKVAKVHGEHATEVVEINRLFQAVASELSSHMQKEEMVLFPLIKELHSAKESGENFSEHHCGTVANPIRMMEMEHENAGDVLKEIRELSNDFSPPEWACNTYRALYAKLEEFETDLHIHIHLENNILHPLALKLENKS